MAVLRDLGSSVASAGFRKLVLYNTHGGNTSLIDVMARDLRAEFELAHVCAARFRRRSPSRASIRRSAPTAFTPAKWKPRFCSPRCPNWSIAPPTRRITSRTSTSRNCCCRKTPRPPSPGSRATSPPSGVMGDPRPATAEKGARWIERSRHASCRGARSHGPLPGSANLMSDADWVDCGNGVRLERGVRCRMSDGVELVSDHYYPPQPGPHPTLLMRQPYGRDIASTVVYAHPVWFARHGYNVVIQDVRGRGDSEGEFYPFRHEARDGAETIAWLRTRPESNGRVGMYGFSYQGMTQLLAAAEQPEGLECIAPGMTAYDLYHGWFYHQGALRLASSLGWGLQMLKADARRKQLREASDRLEQAWANLASQTSVLPFREHPALHGEGLPRYVLDWFDHRPSPANIGPRSTSASRFDRIRVPALHISGWYDMFLKGSDRRFSRADAMRGRARRARTSISDRRAVGAHSVGRSRRRRGFRRRGSARYRRDSAALVQSLAEGFRRICERAAHPPFRAGRKSLARSRRLARRSEHALYLHSDGRANSRKGDGALSSAQPDSETNLPTFSFTIPKCRCSRREDRRAPSGQFDQAALELGNNLLVYTTEPLAEPASHLRHAARLALLRHFCGAHGFHREAGARAPERRGRIHLHRHRAIELGSSRNRLRRRQDSSLGIRSRTHLLPFRRGRPHSPGNRQQRLSALRPQSGQRSAFAARHFVGLAALDADGASQRAISFGALSAGERGAGMSAAISPCRKIEFDGVSKRYGNGSVGARRHRSRRSPRANSSASSALPAAANRRC